MKLLIVGGSGFIGRNVIEQLTARDYPFSEVTAVYRQSAGFDAWCRKRGVKPLYLDLRDPKLALDSFDVALYLAGNADHAIAARQPQVDFDLNAGAMLRFLNVFRGRLVYLSSGAVYTGHQGLVGPATALRPNFAYGISKLTSELYASAARLHGELASLAILRLFYAFGRHDKLRRLVPRVLTTVAGHADGLFRVSGNGRSFINPLYAGFVADVLLTVAARRSMEGVFDLCGENNRTVAEFVSQVAGAVGLDLLVEPSGEPEAHPVLFYASSRDLYEALALRPSDGLREEVGQTLTWIKENH